ncbi:LacI family transcriptional regulator [Miniimonas arenae]|uniref:LacI family transcriptional regulator n=1 Tax=Miniimonas arenae TaxID=676201 RepID=A0A5C5B8C8_9MICO|nr:LacI family DNA-binding transcriptional regulator [Miniimonas arenae]TNU73128.1 LacI family transcriptional regulator [Miniimonas arenae]
MGRAPTSRDVARAAGVAQSTVSHVLTGRATVAPETRERVLRAIADLGYQPNLAARSMRTRRTGRLAVVLSVSLVRPVQVLDGATQVALEAGYAVEVHSVEGDAATVRERVAALARSGQYEGIVVLAPLGPWPAEGAPGAAGGTRSSDDAAPAEGEASADRGSAVVVASPDFDDHLRGAGGLADASAVREFVAHLADLGYHRFLHVAGPVAYPSARARAEAYRAAVAALGVESLGVHQGDWGGACGVEAILALPAEAPPLAVIAANDVVATGVLRGAHERGWTRPGQLAVTGWDDQPTSAFLVPSLTTVTVDRPELGRRAMRLLLARLRGGPSGPADAAAPDPLEDHPVHQIVWRESTLARAASAG